MSLRIYTQTNANIRTPGNQCVQWRIVSKGLWKRNWATNWRDDPASLVTDWTIVAEGIQNQSVTPQVSAFALDADPAKGGRVIVVSLLVNSAHERGVERVGPGIRHRPQHRVRLPQPGVRRHPAGLKSPR